MNSPRNTMDDAPAVVTLGANLPWGAGGPLQTLRHAVGRLDSLSDGETAVSAPYRSRAVGCEPGAPDFINAAVLFTPRPGFSPKSLMRALLAIETEFGRRRDGPGHQSRTLDLDLICWGSRQITTAELTLPHPRAAERAFVLAPLAELAPDLILPGATVSVRELLSNQGATAREIQQLSWEDI